MDVESEYLDRKGTYDKVAVGLEMDKQALEKECDTFQVSLDMSSPLLLEMIFELTSPNNVNRMTV